MRKVLFLMFLLLLMGLGAAGVKAQVRIGGNAAPNASALLDLNASDATNNGTKGLALPRVDLTSPTMLLSGVASNLTGMMVYNTTATLGQIGIFFWNGNAWVAASLPPTSPSNSGYMLLSNGTTAFWSPDTLHNLGHVQGWTINAAGPVVTWTKIIDIQFDLGMPAMSRMYVDIPGLTINDLCTYGEVNLGSSYLPYVAVPGSGYIIFSNPNTVATPNTLELRCYRPSA